MTQPPYVMERIGVLMEPDPADPLEASGVLNPAEQPWESVKIGAGTVPIRVPEGWMLLFHGVDGQFVRESVLQPKVRYATGAMILAADDVSRVVARSNEPLLAPEMEGELDGIVPNVVFPTALEPIDDDEAFVFYGMADSRIGVARLRRTS